MPIVSLLGEPELHARARRYNQRLVLLSRAKEDLRNAESWNEIGRHGKAFWEQDKPPVATASLYDSFLALEEQLCNERSEIVRLSGETVKP